MAWGVSPCLVQGVPAGTGVPGASGVVLVTADLAAWLTAVWDEEEARERTKRTWRPDAPPMDVTKTHDGEGVLISNPGSSNRHWLSGEEYERSYLTPSPDKQVLARIAAYKEILRLLASLYADREGFRPEWLVERQGVEQ